MVAIFDQVVLLEKYPGKGGWTYAALDGIDPNNKRRFGMITVKGNVDNYPIQQYNLMPMGDRRMFFPINATIRKIIKKEAGDYVKIVLYIDDSPVIIPEEIQVCLNEDIVISKKFAALADTTKKMYIDHIMKAKGIEVKAKRILEMMEKLSNKK